MNNGASSDTRVADINAIKRDQYITVSNELDIFLFLFKFDVKEA